MEKQIVKKMLDIPGAFVSIPDPIVSLSVRLLSKENHEYVVTWRYNNNTNNSIEYYRGSDLDMAIDYMGVSL